MSGASDDQERIDCDQVGELGHFLCGVCPMCRRPRFECGHASTPGVSL